MSWVHLCWCCLGRAFFGGECRTCKGVCRTCNGTGDLDKVKKPNGGINNGNEPSRISGKAKRSE
jgi:hypothetical protein